MKKVFILFLFLTMVLVANARVVYTTQDSLIYERYINQLKADTNLPIGELIVKTALFFRETPYVASTLDNNKSEQLVINLRQFDCTTFVESCIALSRTLKTGDHTFSNFCNQLQIIRYRDGKITDYSSRLHYVTDWIYDNSKKGILKNESSVLGGTLNNKTINFMSSHTDAYKPLRNNSELQQKITDTESQINSRGGYYFVKKENINKISNQVLNGDIVVFATSINGLDYTHIGIAYHDGIKLTFIHASSKAMKVIVEPHSLSDYCLKSTRCIGVSILRIIDLGK